MAKSLLYTLFTIASFFHAKGLHHAIASVCTCLIGTLHNTMRTFRSLMIARYLPSLSLFESIVALIANRIVG